MEYSHRRDNHEEDFSVEGSSSPYAMLVSRSFREKTENYVMEQCGASSCQEEMPYPTFFGLHFCNDPNIVVGQGQHQQDDSVSAPRHNNIEVREDMFAFCTRNISKGDEIYMEYQW